MANRTKKPKALPLNEQLAAEKQNLAELNLRRAELDVQIRESKLKIQELTELIETERTKDFLKLAREKDIDISIMEKMLGDAEFIALINSKKAKMGASAPKPKPSTAISAQQDSTVSDEGIPETARQEVFSAAE